ncbi:Uncharacterized protein HZ326_30191 [Fusarium oxysporum f. sp. albedinis]|nr:Uncharacterized protein HZ326_30191 [Fusarium oxysporum f. sp. albedinis]
MTSRTLSPRFATIRAEWGPCVRRHTETFCHLCCQYKLSWLNLNSASRVCIAWSKSNYCTFDFVASHQSYDSLRCHLACTAPWNMLVSSGGPIICQDMEGTI